MVLLLLIGFIDFFYDCLMMFDLGLSIDSTHTEPSALGSVLDLSSFFR